MYASLEPYGARCILCAQVIQRANNSSYGLAAGVFTKDLDTANHMSRSLRAGTVWINNCWFMLSPSVPFGGHQQSGIGVEGGEAGIQAYTKVCTEVTTLCKSICVLLLAGHSHYPCTVSACQSPFYASARRALDVLMPPQNLDLTVRN